MISDIALFKGQQILADECISGLKYDSKIDPTNQLIIVKGDHGNGKSNFANYVEQQLLQEDWTVMRSKIDKTTKYDLMIEDLTNNVKEQFNDSKEESKFTDCSIIFADLLAKMQRDTQKNVLLIFDGIELNHCSRKWMETFQWIISQNEHVAMLMTVEPERLYKMQHSRELKDFLAVCGRQINLPRATPNEIKGLFQTLFAEHGIKIDEKVLSQITKLTKGNAYAYRVLSNLLLKVALKGDTITETKLKVVLPEYNYLVYECYGDIFYDLSPSERTFLLGLVDAGKTPTRLISVIHKIREKAEKDKDDVNQERSTAYWAAIRKKLTDCNLVDVPAYGMVAFRLPRFADYVLMASENNLSKMWEDAF